MPTTLRPLAVIDHDPDAELIYSCDWDDWLNVGAEIATSDWFIEDVSTTPDDPLDMTQDNDAIADDGRSATVRILNGTAGHKYRITNRIVTNESPTQGDDRSFFLKVKER